MSSLRTLAAPLVLGAFSCTALRAESPERLRPEDVVRLVEEKGARAAAAELFADDARWNDLLRGTATGGPGWLKGAARLKPGVDSRSSESLNMALSEALLYTPEAVLRLAAGGGIDVADACAWTGLKELDLGRKSQDVLRFLRARKKAVTQVAAPALAKARGKCLKELERREQATLEEAAGGS